MADETGRFNAQRVEEYKSFDRNSFSWQFIEAPALAVGVTHLLGQDIKLLDLGCGTGRVSNYLASMGLNSEHAYGIDISGDMVSEAKNRAPAAHFLQGNIQDLPYDDAFFDLVVSNNVLHFLDDVEFIRVLQGISRVLKKGGHYFFVESNPYQEPSNPRLGDWVTTKTPWGAEIAAFRHDYRKIFASIVEEAGLVCEGLEFPKVLEEGKKTNPDEYRRYTQTDLRITATLQKV